MARPVSITSVFDIPLSSVEPNIIKNIPGETLSEDSLVLISLNGETTDVRAQVSIGGNQILPESNVTIQATNGILPITPDDNIVASFGKKGENITIRGSNLDAAAARELRAKILIFPSSDIAILAQALRGVGVPIAG